MKTYNSNSPKNRGSKTHESSGLSRLLSGNTDSGSTVADWSSVADKSIIRIISALTNAGGAVRFGYSRDGGAYSLGIYLGDDSETLYFKPYEDVGAKLEELAERVTALGQARG